MKNSKSLKFDVKQVFWGLKHVFFSKITMIEIQIIATDNMNETPELLKPMVVWLSTGAAFYMLYLFLLQHLPSNLLDLFQSYPYWIWAS